jgi:Winged helix-turn helix
LARVIKTRFNVTLAERSVGAMLRRLGFRRLSVRPRYPQQDPVAQEAYKKTSPIWSKPSSPEHAREKPIELWWQDEARVGQQGTLTRVWAKRGSRPRRVISAANGPTYSALSALVAISARLWCCLMPTPRR